MSHNMYVLSAGPFEIWTKGNYFNRTLIQGDTSVMNIPVIDSEKNVDYIFHD